MVQKGIQNAPFNMGMIVSFTSILSSTKYLKVIISYRIFPQHTGMEP